MIFETYTYVYVTIMNERTMNLKNSKKVTWKDLGEVASVEDGTGLCYNLRKINKFENILISF